jgi:hypothetical protein
MTPTVEELQAAIVRMNGALGDACLALESCEAYLRADWPASPPEKLQRVLGDVEYGLRMLRGARQ